MKVIRTLGCVAAVALAATLLLGVASASAAPLALESCMEGKLPQECKAATVGATFKAVTSTVKLANGVITNTCHGTVGGKVTDAESAEGAGEADKITATITEATFTECSFTPAEARKTDGTKGTLDWILETWDTLFLASSTGKILGARVVFPNIGCEFAEDATHTVVGTWKNAVRSKVVLSGSMKRIAGSEFFCGSEGTISGEYEISAVTDPNLSSPVNLQILK